MNAKLNSFQVRLNLELHSIHMTMFNSDDVTLEKIKIQELFHDIIIFLVTLQTNASIVKMSPDSLQIHVVDPNNKSIPQNKQLIRVVTILTILYLLAIVDSICSKKPKLQRKSTALSFLSSF